jgi:hypothetical protein
MKHLLWYSNIGPTKKVENFAWKIFEEFFAKTLGGVVIDTDSSSPDILVEKNDKKYLFEIKSANRWNSALLKLNQLGWFAKLKNSCYVFIFYDCPSPTKVYGEKWIDWFIENMWLDSIYMIPSSLLKWFAEENTHLSRRVKLTYIWVSRDETVIKLSKRRLEEFITLKWKEFKRRWNISHIWINRDIIKGFLENFKD